MWQISTATYVPRSAFLEFVERIRARYVEHTCWADKLISVVVIAVRFRVLTQVVFGTAGVGRAILRLLRACVRIRFHMWTRICYVAELVCIGENLWGTHMWISWCVPHLHRWKIRLYWNFSLIRWRLIIILSVNNWLLKVILPRSCI